MMNFDSMIREIKGMNLNLYDFALYTGDQIHTHCFQPSNRCNDSYSVAKAFVVTAIGLLWDAGRLNVTDSLYEILRDDFPNDADPGWRLATVEHAMTHRLGFDRGFLDIDQEEIGVSDGEDYLQIVLRHPLAYMPGFHQQYSDAAFYLLSRVIARIAGENIDSLLLRQIFKPMEFREVAWSRCPLEYPIAATGLYISSEDMVKLGALYLNGGVWKGRRLLSQAWVDKTLANEYEFHAMLPSGLIGKSGLYGQALVFSRERGFAAAWHGYEPGDRPKQLIDYLDAMCGSTSCL